MNSFLYVFLVCIILLAVIMALAVMFLGHHNDEGNDNHYLDEQGRHLYYDRSRIAKEEYLREHPDENPNSLRSFRRLLGFKKHHSK